MEKYIDYEMCKKCGGACCKKTGCIYLPQDFDNLEFDYLKGLLDKGNISISGQPFNPFPNFYPSAWSFLLYLRARNINSDVVDLITLGAPCSLLTKNGCSLNDEDRPSLGLLVKPTVIGGPCEKMYFSEDAMAWLDYSAVLSELIRYYTNKETIEVIVEHISRLIVPIKKKLSEKMELTNMESIIASWYFHTMSNRPYYTPEEVKKMRLSL